MPEVPSAASGIWYRWQRVCRDLTTEAMLHDGDRVGVSRVEFVVGGAGR